MTDLLPDKPNWIVWLFFGLSIAIIVSAFFWDRIVRIVINPTYNWHAGQVVHYLQKWTKLRNLYLRELEEVLRQVVLDGDITVWGTLGIAGPMYKMPSEKFATYTFDFRNTIGGYNPDAALAPQSRTKIYEDGQRDNFLHKEIYYDPSFNKAEIKRKWRRQWFRTLWREFQKHRSGGQSRTTVPPKRL